MPAQLPTSHTTSTGSACVTVLTLSALTNRYGKGEFGSQHRGSEKRVHLKLNYTDQCKMLPVSEKNPNSDI